MLPVLLKVFVVRFYRTNAGFFLFFFFVFFGAVEGNNLLPYHLSLMKSILGSATVLLLVCGCWLLYHFKCVVFFLKTINSGEGQWLHALQCSPAGRQWRVCATLYTGMFAPVLVYALLVAAFGFAKGFTVPALCVLAFQFLSVTVFVFVIHRRVNDWLAKRLLPSFRLPIQKRFPLFLLFHFTAQRQTLFLALKAFSLLLLYLVLVWNRGRYDNDAFILVYVVVIFAHALLPWLAVGFFEESLSVARNLPLSFFQRAAAFALPYVLLTLPEGVYLFLQADAFTLLHRLAYYLCLPVGLCLLTAVQYSGAQSRNDYLSAACALLFVSIFVFHAQAFGFWLAAQLCVAALLFAGGFYSYEKPEE